MPVKKYELWLGHYILNDGLPEVTKPNKVATIVAASFKMACLKYELTVKMTGILEAEKVGQPLDDQSCNWFYDYLINRNNFTGHYFETEDEAWETFPKGRSNIILQ